jgi:hypothetical protein
VLEKIVDAAARNVSFQDAAGSLAKQAGLKISVIEVSRIAGPIGRELQVKQEPRARQHARRELPASAGPPPAIACVQREGGRLRTRAPEQGRGVHAPRWKEDKVAALWKMQGATFEADPHPAPPKCFCDPGQVARLVKGLKQRQLESESGRAAEPEPASSLAESAPRNASQRKPRLWPAQRIFRTSDIFRPEKSCVATLKDVHEFGPLLSAEAQRRGFYDAGRQVFLGDGDQKNWTVHQGYFPHFTAVTDFIHPLSYLYESAAAVTSSEAAQWEQYLEWMTDRWQGRVDKVLEEMRAWQQRLGLPPAETPPDDPRETLRRAITYLEHNAPRMDYPSYRREGLPITSCLVESLIKQINQRVKGSDKFWNRPEGAEAILQLRAAFLSDGDVLDTQLRSRPGCAYYRRSTAAAAKPPS